MKIEVENLFLKACREGINIFTGSGFSYNSFNFQNVRLPVGSDLGSELSHKFDISANLPLANLSTILESKDKVGFYDFLKKRLNVKNFASEYKNIEFLNIKSWFTTNIDNLTEKIFEHSDKYYLNNNILNGPSFSDRNAVEFYPLHGSITNDNKPLIFSSLSIASTFSSSPKIWTDLVRAIEKKPILFWGYSLSDSGILQTLNSINLQGIDKKDKWIVLFKEMPDEEIYFKSLGFNIIIADNIELLNYFFENLKEEDENFNKSNYTTKQLFHQDFVPSSSIGLPVREITEFFLGSAPIWSDIFSKNLYKTSHFQIIQNLIFSNKTSIIVGTPASGKTTLLMQLAAYTEFKGHKIILNYPTIEKCKNVISKLNGEKAIIFIDNFTDDIQSFILLHKYDNIKLLGFDREHNFEIVSHFVNRNEFNFHSVTSLNDTDIQEIFNRIPDTIKNKNLKTKQINSDEQASLFEFVSLNLKYPDINERFKNIIFELEKNDELLTDFLLLSCYVHQCRIPLSFDMAYSYFQDYISNYKEIYELKDNLGSLITEYFGNLVDDQQDFFMPRSVILAETIIKQVESKYLRRMLHRFVDNLPPYKISDYHIFKKRGHDKGTMMKAFPDWEEGKYYFERLMQDDPNNPYLLQQGALYLSHKSKFNEAFFWIDKARNMTNDRVYSIRNSHAIILFEANIRKDDSSVKATLDRSMEILKQCYIQDKRRLYHAKKFAEQSLEYFDKYGDSRSFEYLDIALTWLLEEIKINDWNRGLKELKLKIERKKRNF